MSVQEQMPIVVYVANGNTNRFAITFDLHDQNYLVVTLNNEVAQVGSYSVLDGEVVFGTAPADGSLVTLYRDTQLNRTTDYKSYDNSFRPESVNWDFDKLWHVLQEQNLIDGKILARIKDEIEWRRTHDFNYDELAQVREKQLFDALKGYADTLYSATNPNVFAGVIAGVVFARDGKSIQTHIEEILDNLAVSREDIDSKADQTYVDERLSLKADQVTTYSKNEVDSALALKAPQATTYTKAEVDTTFAAYVGGRKAYTTLALAQADQVNLTANTAIEVTNDPTAANNGTYQWDGTTLTKSAYDPLTQSKAYYDDSLEFTYPNLYEVAPKTANMYVGASTLVTVTDGALVGFPIEINKTYLIKAPAFMSSNLRYVGLAEAGSAVNGKAITKRDLLPTSDPSIFKFSTTSADSAFVQAFFTTKLVSQSYDVRDTVSIYEGFISTDTTPYLSKLKGRRVAKPQNPTVISRFANKKVWAAGDSITKGTTYTDENGVTIPTNTYVEYLAAAFGTYIDNHGSSGATVARVVDIICAGSGIALRDGTVSYGAKDLTDLACFTLMIGTNDANSGVLGGSIDQLPSGKFDDYATADEYASLFPNNFLCNIALIIEYIRWKSPKCEIHIIAPPYRNRPSPNSDLPSKMTNVLPYLEAVCRHYGVHLIYGIYECGIGYKDMSPLPKKTYSYDGVHFTKLGNEIFGKFVAQKVLSFG